MTGVSVSQQQSRFSGQMTQRLRAVVLLGGSLRPTRLSAAIDRSILDLPVDADRSLLEHWCGALAALRRELGRRDLPTRLMLAASALQPAVREQSPASCLLIERDPFELRGTGGVLRDLSCDYDPDDYLLVANAGQVLMQPLHPLVEALARPAADVALISHHDGTPSGLMLVRCGSLSQLPALGFIDMKEQALLTIAREHRVQVVERVEPTGLPVRTLADYLDALRSYHRQRSGASAAETSWEEWKPSFSLVEDGAAVGKGARVHDSVVLSGAKVGDGAVVVNSVVCAGAKVRPGQMAVDELVGGVRKR